MRTITDIGYPTENGEYEVRLAPYHQQSHKAVMLDGKIKIDGDDNYCMVEDVLHPRDMWTKIN